jgi:hypothetical protein
MYTRLAASYAAAGRRSLCRKRASLDGSLPLKSCNTIHLQTFIHLSNHSINALCHASFIKVLISVHLDNFLTPRSQQCVWSAGTRQLRKDDLQRAGSVEVEGGNNLEDQAWCFATAECQDGVAETMAGLCNLGFVVQARLLKG